MDSTAQLERVLAAPPGRVWQAFTDPSRLSAWFWPFPTSAQVDLRPDGVLRIEAPDAPGGAVAVSGRYTTVVAPDRLGFTWRWAGEDEETLVTIELSAVDGGTRLEVTHSGFADRATRDNHVVGWSDCLDRLPPYITQKGT